MNFYIYPRVKRKHMNPIFPFHLFCFTKFHRTLFLVVLTFPRLLLRRCQVLFCAIRLVVPELSSLEKHTFWKYRFIIFACFRTSIAHNTIIIRFKLFRMLFRHYLITIWFRKLSQKDLIWQERNVHMEPISQWIMG